mgnify:FL=1|jgi:hypothetical protein
MKEKKVIDILYLLCHSSKTGAICVINGHLQKKKELSQRLNSFIFTSRGDWIRTSDHTPPRRVL